jgi:universal stress protein F
VSERPILAAVDLADPDAAQMVIREAVFEAEARDRPLVCMAVIPEAFAGLDWRYVIRGAEKGLSPGHRKALVRQSIERLSELVADAASEDVEVDTIAVIGIVYQKVLETAQDLGASMIAIAAGESSWHLEEIGPNAARVARHSPCMVLLVRSESS